MRTRPAPSNSAPATTSMEGLATPARRPDQVSPDSRQRPVAILVFLPRSAGARLVATDLPVAANEGAIGLVRRLRHGQHPASRGGALRQDPALRQATLAEAWLAHAWTAHGDTLAARRDGKSSALARIASHLT